MYTKLAHIPEKFCFCFKRTEDRWADEVECVLTGWSVVKTTGCTFGAYMLKYHNNNRLTATSYKK